MKTEENDRYKIDYCLSEQQLLENANNPEILNKWIQFLTDACPRTNMAMYMAKTKKLDELNTLKLCICALGRIGVDSYCRSNLE